AEKKSGNAEIEQKLQRINVKQDQKKHHAGQKTRKAVVEPVTPAKFVVRIPDQSQQQKTNRERRKPAHCVDQIVERSWHIERNNQQGQRKPKHCVAERFQPRYLVPPQAESNKIMVS